MRNFRRSLANICPYGFKDTKAHGLFVALPGVNSHAMGYYRDNCEANDKITVRLLQEPDVLDALIQNKSVISDQEIAKKVDASLGTPGDNILLCSDKGFFWIQYIVPIGSGIASKLQIFDALGHTITDRPTIDYLADLIPEVGDFEIVTSISSTTSSLAIQDEDINDVVELRGSSSCFEYQFPASPEYFVGRSELLDQIDEYIVEILESRTSSRGMLFEANSGWGKSSLVLATTARVRSNGHYAIAIDSRSASSSKFVMRAVQHVLDQFGDFNSGLSNRPVISGFDGAVRALIDVGEALKSQGKLLFIFFDQFENIFYLIDVLTKISQLVLKIADSRTNVILGFSWKTDLVGLTRDFPYRWRDTIVDSCRVFRLKQFSEVETNGLLDRLGNELHTKIRKDLRSLLSEFSQGYPWLLKKLCAHVKNQYTAGIPQAEMARSLLYVDQLFLEDLEGLTAREEEVLRGIARIAPVNISDLGEEFSPAIVQSLVNRRLVVEVGSKYDIYWDIFRDYLNTGKLPIQEIYLPRTQVGSVTRAISILQKAKGALDIVSFKQRAGISDGAFLNVARDLRLLSIANIKDEKLLLAFPMLPGEKEIFGRLRSHLNEILPRNRCVYDVLKLLKEKSEINIQELAEILRQEFPYISAVEQTWITYARVLATWLDIADLAFMDENKTYLCAYRVGSQIRERSILLGRKRSEITVPAIHFAPIVQVATRLISAAQNNSAVDWSGITRSTIYKSLSMLEEMKLISKRATTIQIFPDCYAFVNDENRRLNIAIPAATKWPLFKAFIDILTENKSRRLSNEQLGLALKTKFNLNWTEGTAETNAKIMMDWARHLGLAPGTFMHSERGRFKLEVADDTMSLFNAISSPDTMKEGGS